ncbi:MAG: U32 family peptidase [Clostridia bacterium]|nr:U32 family peptidase [Clostridia bacterium]
MEILSPAGSMEALRAAVNHGADAVYVGGSRFSARKNAQNFSDEELREAVDFCHVRGVRLYLCCNTLLKETELSDAMDFIRCAYQIGVDALIVQDFGLAARIRRELPEMPIHASTQMTVVNSEGIRALESLGVSRVVLAREVSREEIASIRKKTDMELEYFVHGALCISYSGQCLMSSILGGRSGNRGGCAQPCRLPYTLLRDSKPVTEILPLLCPKDLCLADRVHELAGLGVASLKIEGRMKSPDYVAMVTQVYKRAAEGGVSNEEIKEMLKFFSRGGSCRGYFYGCTYGDMMDMAGASKIAGSLPKLAPAEKTVPIHLYLAAQTDKPLSLTLLAENYPAVTVTGAVCQKAHTQPTTAERMEQQISKLGGTAFRAEQVEVQASCDVAVPVSELNALRRQGVQKLEKTIKEHHQRELPAPVPAAKRATARPKELSLCVEVRTEEQLRAAIQTGVQRVYMPKELLAYAEGIEEPVVQLLPLTKEGQKVSLVGAKEVCLQNIGQLTDTENCRITAGHRFNITNSETVEWLKSMGVSRAVLSPELHMNDIARLRKQTDMTLEVIAYGRLPLMLMENCIIKSAYGCHCDKGEFALRDRKNEVFPLLPRHCGTEILNSKPIYMADRIDDIKKLGIDSMRLAFTLENYETCCIIIREYQEAMQGKQKKSPASDFTRGHFYRGAE